MEANQTIKNFLEKSIEHQRISHAYLFLGEEGIGKKEVALWYEKQLNAQPSHLRSDLLLIEPEIGKRQISMEQIQAVRKWLRLTPHQQQRVVIINPAEAMNPIAQNALLKTLEEPMAQSMIILLANRLQGLEETILSRCQILRFTKPSRKDIQSWLQKLNISPEIIEKVLFFSQRRVEEIKYWLDRSQELNREVEFLRQIETLINGNLVDQLKWTDTLKKDADLEKVLKIALQFYHTLLLKRAGMNGQELSFLIDIPDNSWKDLVRIIEQLQNTKNVLRTNVNKKIAFNQLFINL